MFTLQSASSYEFSLTKTITTNYYVNHNILVLGSWYHVQLIDDADGSEPQHDTDWNKIDPH